MTSSPHKPSADILSKIIKIEILVVKHIKKMDIPPNNPAAISPCFLPFIIKIFSNLDIRNI